MNPPPREKWLNFADGGIEGIIESLIRPITSTRLLTTRARFEERVRELHEQAEAARELTVRSPVRYFDHPDFIVAYRAGLKMGLVFDVVTLGIFQLLGLPVTLLDKFNEWQYELKPSDTTKDPITAYPPNRDLYPFSRN